MEISCDRIRIIGGQITYHLTAKPINSLVYSNKNYVKGFEKAQVRRFLIAKNSFSGLRQKMWLININVVLAA
jgi:hypothetical protein